MQTKLHNQTMEAFKCPCYEHADVHALDVSDQSIQQDGDYFEVKGQGGNRLHLAMGWRTSKFISVCDHLNG